MSNDEFTDAEVRAVAARELRRLIRRLAEDLSDLAVDLGERAASTTVGELLADDDA